MAIGRVNVGGVNVEDLSIFEVETHDVAIENIREFNVFEQVGTTSTKHRILEEYESIGRDGNILIFAPKVEGERWWVVEYNFTEEKFKKQKELNLKETTYGGYISRLGDFNKIKIHAPNGKKEVVILGEYKSTPPSKGHWISDNISIEQKFSHSNNFIYYKNGEEEMFKIPFDDYFRREGFKFFSKDISITANYSNEITFARIYNADNYKLQEKREKRTVFGEFGTPWGDYRICIYDIGKDTFLHINTKTGKVVEKKWFYKSVDW